MNKVKHMAKGQRAGWVLGSYLKERRYLMVFVLVFAGIQGIVYALYRIPSEPVLYGGTLILSVVILAAVPDYINYRKKYLFLGVNETLPKADGPLEQRYQELFLELKDSQNRMSDDFAAARQDMVDYYTIWVHQIKTPIAAMRLLLQTEDGLMDTELPTELFKIEQYVEMVLHYLRLEEGGSDFLFRQYQLDDIVKQAVRKYSRIFVRKRLKLNLGDLNFQIVTDEKWFQFVMEQLISNAVKYTQNGQISIYMDLSHSSLVIEDTGMGINPEDLPRIFEKGFTGYNGRQDKKSTGIGLYLCQKVLKKLSLTITAESEAGKGTRMRIFFNMQLQPYNIVRNLGEM